MNNTLQNGFLVLEYLAQSGAECSVKEIAEHFKLPQSHACRLLKTLKETGYVIQTDGTRKYRIGLKILSLSHARLRQVKLRQLARPYLRQLTRSLERPVFLGAAEHGFSVVVATEYPELFHGDAGIDIGALHSINRSACGKICTAWDVPPEELDDFLEQGDWDKAVPNSIVDREEFKRELDFIRENGYAVIISERSVGLGAVAAPVFGAEKRFLGAVGAIMPQGEENWNLDVWNHFIFHVGKCAESISFASGFPLG